MMRAAVACADNEGPPPPELKLAWQCKQYGALPRPGGLLDQPAGLLDKMTACLNTYNAWRGYIKAPYKSEWVAQNPDEWRIVGEIIKAGLHR